MAANGPDDGLPDVAVIGGGQAGLAMAWHLAREQLRYPGFTALDITGPFEVLAFVPGRASCRGYRQAWGTAG